MGFLGRYRAAVSLFSGSLLSSFGAMHFAASLYFWGRYFASGEGRFEWMTVLTCGAAVLLLSVYSWAFVLFLRGRQRRWRVLAAAMMISAALFISDVSRDNWQLEWKSHRVLGGTTVDVCMRRHYLNWWWYCQFDSETLTNLAFSEGRHLERAGL